VKALQFFFVIILNTIYSTLKCAYREVDLSASVAEYLRAFINGKDGPMFKTAKFSSSREAREQNIEDRVAKSVVREMGIRGE
jgi:hypothetical protein